MSQSAKKPPGSFEFFFCGNILFEQSEYFGGNRAATLSSPSPESLVEVFLGRLLTTRGNVWPPVGEVIRKMGISTQTFYRCKKQFGQMGLDEIRRLKQVEEENRKLKQRVADLSLDKLMLQDVLSRKL